MGLDRGLSLAQRAQPRKPGPVVFPLPSPEDLTENLRTERLPGKLSAADTAGQLSSSIPLSSPAEPVGRHHLSNPHGSHDDWQCGVPQGAGETAPCTCPARPHPPRTPFTRRLLHWPHHCAPHMPIYWAFSGGPSHCALWVKMVRVWGSPVQQDTFRKRQ